MDIKEILDKHHHEYEVLQWTIMSSIGSLVYAEYISKIKPVVFPIKCYKVPTIKSVQEMLHARSPYIEELEKRILDEIKNSRYSKYISKMEIFNDDNKSEFLQVLVGYILKNVYIRIPEVIEKKFGLDDNEDKPKKTQDIFREDKTIDLFDRDFSQEWMIQYTLKQISLQLVTFIEHPKHSIEGLYTDPDKKHRCYNIPRGSFVSVNHENAVCPIFIDREMLELDKAMKLISFVTSTGFTSDGDSMLINSPVTIALMIYNLEGNNE